MISSQCTQEPTYLLRISCLYLVQHAHISVLSAKTDPDFKAFLAERNPRQQHSSTLESYLIKPIQRVLKYPLLLKELYSLTDPDSEEHYHLDGKPASFIIFVHFVFIIINPNSWNCS